MTFLSHFRNSLRKNNLELALQLGVCYAVRERIRDQESSRKQIVRKRSTGAAKNFATSLRQNSICRRQTYLWQFSTPAKYIRFLEKKPRCAVRFCLKRKLAQPQRP